VQGFAIRYSVQMLSDLQHRFNGHPNSRLFYIGHQANLRMIENVSQRCNIAAEKHLHNVERYGNTATAGSPSMLSEHWKRFQAGDDVAMVGVGAGLSWSSAMVRFTNGADPRGVRGWRTG
jgi:3-oxoacyl-[acyl-carrier-protein] synthase-3